MNGNWTSAHPYIIFISLRNNITSSAMEWCSSPRLLLLQLKSIDAVNTAASKKNNAIHNEQRSKPNISSNVAATLRGMKGTAHVTQVLSFSQSALHLRELFLASLGTTLALAIILLLLLLGLEGSVVNEPQQEALGDEADENEDEGGEQLGLVIESSDGSIGGTDLLHPREIGHGGRVDGVV